ncbi:cupin-like domain-containing protein [Pedobacter chinensis]|uniref:Cupin-like domain-containing protein n=1 Tax=Pedobacter chinensis TaxID=2282421 RepID=A0A369PZ02_9SPHI|nr:cupin-like domain-containing protein [Pedobacter chinensis]RDC55986.1 cupin-like domain-containing protein [Pedobacter chinensis]
MTLEPIPYLQGLDIADFKKNYVQRKRPVILCDFISQSSAFKNWNYDYFRKEAGNKIVAVHGSEDAHPDYVTSPPERQMLFSDYLDLIEREPSELRLFLFNLLVYRPKLRKALKIIPPMKGFLTNFPLLFFGGKGASVRYHYDIDMSHVFLSQFEGEKRIFLFANDQSDLLYKFPFNFHGPVDLRKPDYEKYPALKLLKGWECVLKPGETLYIPSGYWHYIQYLSQGYSVSNRALSASLTDKLKGFRNILIIRRIDNLLRRLFGQKWFNYKLKRAKRNAERHIRA